MPLWVYHSEVPFLPSWKETWDIHVYDGAAWRPVNVMWVYTGAGWARCLPTALGAITNAVGSFDSSSRAKVTFGVGAETRSVWIEYRISSGAWSTLQTVNTVPGQTGYVSNTVQGSRGVYIDFRLTPYSKTNKQGLKGIPTEVTVYIPNPVASISAGKNDTDNTAWANFTVNGDTNSVSYSVSGRGSGVINVSPGGGGSLGPYAVSDNETITFSVTPYSGSDGSGVQGSSVSDSVTMAPPPPPPPTS